MNPEEKVVPKRKRAEGAGRPTTRGGACTHVQAYILPADKDRLVEAAKKKGQSLSAFVGDLLEHLAKQL